MKLEEWSKSVRKRNKEREEGRKEGRKKESKDGGLIFATLFLSSHTLLFGSNLTTLPTISVIGANLLYYYSISKSRTFGDNSN